LNLPPLNVSQRVPIDAGQHICAMHFGLHDRDNVLLPFLGDGLADGHKCFTAIQESDSAALISKLRDHTERGHVDLLESLAREQLEVKTSSEQLLSQDVFDPMEILEFWDNTVNSALDSGFDFVRLSAEAAWWMPQMPGMDDLFRYESELNRFTPKHPQAVLCLYDLSQYGESIIIDLLKTHPLVLLSGIPIENPYYLTPDEYLAKRSNN
jgi:hypothetical protein